MASSEPQPPPQPAEEAPGSWFWPIDLRIVYQALRTFNAQATWAKRTAASLRCPVFKAEPGWRCLIVTDANAAAQVFHAPTSEFDRDDGFMNASFDYNAMLEGVCPAFMARELRDGLGTHRVSRAFVRRAVAARGFNAFAVLCTAEMKATSTRTVVEEVRISDALAENSIRLMFPWYIGADGPSSKEAQDFTMQMLYTRCDSKPMAWVIEKLKPRPKGEVLQLSEELLDSVRVSKFYGEYCGIAHEVGMPEKDVAPQLLANCLLNACSPAFAVGHPAVAQLYKDDALRTRLAAEVAGVSDAEALANLPLLDGFLMESMRFFGQPSRTSRRAVRDTTLNLDDRRVIKVAKDTSVQIIHTEIRDEHLSDPESFRPERFIEDQGLKEKMFTFGFLGNKDEPTSFGCCGAEVGVAQLLWKMAVLPFIKDTRATIKEEYEIKREGGTSPKELTWVPSK